MNCKKTLLILAGGLGTRYRGLKQVDGILEKGSPILEYSIYDALEAGFNKIVIVINRFLPGNYLERLRNISVQRNFELVWVYQEMETGVPANQNISFRKKPWGTGHAVLCAKDVIEELFAVINADDFYGKEIYRLASEEMDSGAISATRSELIAYPVETTLSKNGRVARGICTLDHENYLLKIEEQTSVRRENNVIVYTEKDINVEISSDTLVSMNFFVFHPAFFNSLETYFTDFMRSSPSPEKEFYIPVAVQNMINEEKIKVRVKSSPSQWMGMTYAEDKIMLKNNIIRQIQQNRYPEDLWN